MLTCRTTADVHVEHVRLTVPPDVRVEHGHLTQFLQMFNWNMFTLRFPPDVQVEHVHLKDTPNVQVEHVHLAGSRRCSSGTWTHAAVPSNV